VFDSYTLCINNNDLLNASPNYYDKHNIEYRYSTKVFIRCTKYPDFLLDSVYF